ncbi:GTPase IMAP family member 4-like [Morone saxatilis]|uniref:GTPase IMAP family member 4-like n=1 Tax=Morone saxatilis TaxID=34816 RepID=UPI0015E23D05|nr:GTPase IMAP family member 4-like [Morone saxatilis]
MASKLLHPQYQQCKDQELQIVIVGNTGVGKSTTGNTILMRTVFQTPIHLSSVTQACKKEKGEFDGQKLAVVDTPGLFGGTKSDVQVMEEIKKAVLSALDGPVAFLVVLQLGRLTEDEQKTVKLLQKTFGREAAHHTMALFTRGDDLKEQGGSIEDFIGANPALRDFVRECRGGYHVFENIDGDPSQVVELLQKINSMVRRNGESYNKMDRNAEGVLWKENLETSATEEAEKPALIDSCLHGAFNGAYTFGALCFVANLKSQPVEAVVVGGIIGGVVGAAVGAAQYVGSKLITE